MHIRAAAVLAAAALAACGDRGAAREEAAASDSAATPGAPTTAAPPAPAAVAAVAARGRWTTPCLRVVEDVTAASARDTVCFRDAREYDFAGDGQPFTVSVEARGPRPDSLRAALRITRGDAVLYRDDWSTALYASYDRQPVSADSARRRAEAQLGRLLADEAFRPVGEQLAGAADRDRALRDAIALDVGAEAARRRGRQPRGARSGAGAAPLPTPDTARVRALAAELRDRPSFRYFAGGEATYAVAWSPSERRFVVVYGCC